MLRMGMVGIAPTVLTLTRPDLQSGALASRLTCPRFLEKSDVAIVEADSEKSQQEHEEAKLELLNCLTSHANLYPSYPQWDV